MFSGNISCVHICAQVRRRIFSEYHCIICICISIYSPPLARGGAGVGSLRGRGWVRRFLCHYIAQRPHLLGRASHDDIAAHVPARPALEAQFHKGTPQQHTAEFLRDASTHHLQGQRHADELARLPVRRTTEIQLHQFVLQPWCLKLLVVLISAVA